MKNFIQEGNSLDLIAPSGGVVSGVGYLFGAIFAVASVTVAEGEAFAGWTEGVYELAAETHATTQAIAQGGPVFYDATNKRCTATGAGNTLIGVAVEDKVSTVATVKVKLLPRFAAAGVAIADLSLSAVGSAGTTPDLSIAAVTGVDGVGDNAASKADVDTAFAAIVTKVNAMIDLIEGAALGTGVDARFTTTKNKVNAIIDAVEASGDVTA